MKTRDFWSWFEKIPVLKALIEWSKVHSLPGFARIPIFHVIDFIREEMKEDAIITRANSMAFSFFLSMFPAIIVLFTILAYTPLYANFAGALEDYIISVMPGNAGKVAFKVIEDIATKQRSGLLSVGFFLSLWFSSNGVLSMLKGFEKNHKMSFLQRTGLQKRLVAVKLTFLLAFILIGSVILIILGNAILNVIFGLFDADWITKMFVFLFRWVVILLLFYMGISTIYREGSALRRKIRFINPGAILATGLSILTSIGFSFYVDNFNAYNKVYGSIGTLIVLLIWLQINCFILLIGFELNASIAVNRDMRSAKTGRKA